MTDSGSDAVHTASGATATGTTATGSLDGLQVLDVAGNVSGQYAAQLMADMGASVTRLEPSDTDSLGPYYRSASADFNRSLHRNKALMTVTGGPDAVRRAIDEQLAAADAVVAGSDAEFGVLAGPGAAEALRTRHRDVVWSAVSGFGNEGPLSAHAPDDLMVQAATGVIELTGEPRLPHSGAPADDRPLRCVWARPSRS